MKIVRNKNSKQPCEKCKIAFTEGEFKIAVLYIPKNVVNRYPPRYTKYIKRTHYYHGSCLKKKYLLEDDPKKIKILDRVIKAYCEIKMNSLVSLVDGLASLLKAVKKRGI